jgi:hypothetical protein
MNLGPIHISKLIEHCVSKLVHLTSWSRFRLTNDFKFVPLKSIARGQQEIIPKDRIAIQIDTKKLDNLDLLIISCIYLIMKFRNLEQ